MIFLLGSILVVKKKKRKKFIVVVAAVASIFLAFGQNKTHTDTQNSRILNHHLTFSPSHLLLLETNSVNLEAGEPLLGAVCSVI